MYIITRLLQTSFIYIVFNSCYMQSYLITEKPQMGMCLINVFIIWQALRAGKMNQIPRGDWLPERARWMTSTSSRSIKTQKENSANIQPYYTTQAVKGPIIKINQSKCSIAGPIFSKYWTRHCPE